MRRREFITLLGGAAAAWAFAADAQQTEHVRRIGVLTPFAANDAEGQARLTAFAQGLQHSGWIVGQNIRIEYRWGDGRADTMRKYAAELVALAPDVMLASSSAAVAPLLEATRTVPIVFAGVGDPVAGGYVESQARPGGNAAGFTVFEYSMSGKWLELLKEVAPRVTRSAVLRDATIAAGPGQFGASRRWRHRSAWTCAPLTYAMPARSNARSRLSRRARMAAWSCSAAPERRSIAT